jgi:two-component system CheB/CheR fusion protein
LRKKAQLQLVRQNCNFLGTITPHDIPYQTKDSGGFSPTRVYDSPPLMTEKKHKYRTPQARKSARGMPMQKAPSQGANERPTHPSFPVVGIGASAGGLEALEVFLRHVPHSSGMALVIIQHLDPTHKGVMPELLQRVTPMKVLQVKDQTRVQRDCVYVIPPNKDMSILHGVLHLFEPVTPRGLRLPIDFFFRSLADDQQGHSIGVILSGMGSDGTLGLRAIKEKAGVVFVQTPASAKFDGMPRSVIDAGLADVVAPVEELPGKILAYVRHTPITVDPTIAGEDKSHSTLEKIVILLRAKTGHDFSLYKKNTLYRRIERRMGIHQVEKITTYLRLLQENPHELEFLFKELLIGVTRFFRDSSAWEFLKAKVLPALLSRRAPGQTLRAWVPACATGEEAYSLAIAFKEALEAQSSREGEGTIALQVFATDLDGDAIEKARNGFYPANIAADVSAERLNRFFLQTEQGFQISKSIRERVIFAQQNIIMDPPFTKLDIVSCRNLFIYLAPELQEKLLPLFHYSLNPGGILFLGSAETTGSFSKLFAPLDNRERLYQRLEPAMGTGPVQFPTAFVPGSLGTPQRAPKPVANLQALADQVLLQTYTPAAVLVNDKGDILYISGRTGKYLEPASGKANWNIFAMAREGLRSELSGGLNKALRQKGAVTVKCMGVRTDWATQALEVTIQQLIEPEPLRGMVMIVFREVEAPLAAPKRKAAGGKPVPAKRVTELERELELARQEARAVREEMQTSQEELRSTNEEFQSTNEELQSANEELTTSKEELQSMYEELQTVNREMQVKMEEFTRQNSDMKNLLESTDIATVFLDASLRVRFFTTGTKRIFKLIPGDAGRPITDIASDLLFEDLADRAQEVLRTLVFHERQVSTRDGRWFTVRIMPYRTLANMIDGVVITFTDITVSKKLETDLRETQAGLEEQIGDQNRGQADQHSQGDRIAAPTGRGKDTPR